MKIWFRRRKKIKGDWLRGELSGTAGPNNVAQLSIIRKNKPTVQLDVPSMTFHRDSSTAFVFGYKPNELGDNVNFTKIAYEISFTEPE